MATNEGKPKVDLILKNLDEECKKNPKIKDDFSKTVHDLRDILKKGGKERDQLARTEVKYMTTIKSFDQLPDEVKQLMMESVANPETVTEKSGKDGAKGSSQTPSSAKQQCTGQQGVDAGPALKPTPSKLSPSPGRKDAAETEKLKNEIKQLKAELDEKNKKLSEQTHISEDRLKQIQEKDKEIQGKDMKIREFEDEAKSLSVRLEEENFKRGNAEKDLKAKEQMINSFELQVNEFFSERYQYQTKIKELESAYKHLEKERAHVEHVASKTVEQLQGVLKDEKRKADDEYKKLLAERDDLRDRFSKLAGKKLQEQNADIADLSDPNRAMKLSEKFGQLYDDEWTNAFEYLTDKKSGLQLKEAINVLLHLLQECWTFCNNLMDTQMESLKEVFLHPDQNPENYVKQGKKGVTDRPRVTSKDIQPLKDLRRRIGVSPSVIDEVKQALLTASKSWEKEKKGFDKKHTDACAPYLQKCAEICWLMALHDPPLFMKMEFKHGEKLDANIYTVYSASGTSIDFLVWPPLYNGKDGGLLSKGVAEPLRVVSKKK